MQAQQMSGPMVTQVPSGTLVRQQAPAPYAAYQEDSFGSITQMITAIMPLIMLVLMFKMLTPMLEGFGR